ncbi:OmpA family protein [Paraburkholderia sp. Se-20369]|nr:OmpA family protein [Paraburkholderia sp. Se-20369]
MRSTFQSAEVAATPREPDTLPFGARLRAAEVAANPLFEAARPLLAALAEPLPPRLDDVRVAERRRWLEHEVKCFMRMCTALRIQTDHVDPARYCLCAALDEAAMQTGWGKRGIHGVEWSANGLCVAFGQDRQGADRVFALIELALRSPVEHLDLLEVLQNILDLGFNGRYRHEAGGARKLADVRRRVYDAVVSGGVGSMENWAAAPQMRPMPRWRTDPWIRPAPARKRRRFAGWVAIAAVVLGAAGYAAYVQWGSRLHDGQHPSAVDALAGNLRARLGNEIAAGVIGIEGGRDGTGMTLRFGDLFSPGQVAVNPWVGPSIAAVGQEIAKFPPLRIRVTGHTDNVPLVRAPWESNRTLSLERAEQVAKILVAAGVAADRVTSAGRADEVPIGGNETEDGRARNRRVEISVSE